MVQVDSPKDFQWCSIHKKLFKGDQCDLCIITVNGKVKKRSYKRKIQNSVYERFHNYGVKFKGQVFWDAIFVEPKNLNNNVQYKRLDFPEGFVKVFRNGTVLVTLRANQEVKQMTVRDAEHKSMLIVNTVLDKLPKSILVHDRTVVNVHNAFVNHPIAKNFKNVYGREMNVKDDDGNSVLVTDQSRGHELEYVQPDSVIPLSEKRELYEWDIIKNNPDLPSVLTYKTNIFFNAMENFSLNMNRHVTVMEKIEQGQTRLNDLLELIAKPKRSVKVGSLGVTSPRVRRLK